MDDIETLNYMATAHESGVFEDFVNHAKIDVNSQCENGHTPLMYACAHNNIEVARYLLSRDDIIRDLKDNQGNTALYYAELFGHNDIVKLFKK